MSQQDEQSEEKDNVKKVSQYQKEETKCYQEITDQFKQTNIQGDPSEIHTPQKINEFISNPQDQLNILNQSNIVQIDKRFLLPAEANYITYLSENTKFLKEKYVEHCMDKLQSIQEFVINQGLSQQKKQKDEKKFGQHTDSKFQSPSVNYQKLPNSEQFQQSNQQEVSQKKLSKSTIAYLQKSKDDPKFQQKLALTSKMLEFLKTFEIQSSTKKISILEDSLIVCSVYQKLSNEKQSLHQLHEDFCNNYNYQRSFQAFKSRIKIQRNLYDKWSLELLEQLFKVLQEYPRKLLPDLTLQEIIKFPQMH